MRVIVLEPHGYHTSFLRTYAELLPSLLGTDELDIRYVVRRRLVNATRALLGPGASVESLALGPVDFGPGHTMGAAWMHWRLGSVLRRFAPDVLVCNTLDDAAVQAQFRRLAVGLKVGVLHNTRDAQQWSRPVHGEILACLHRYNYLALRDEMPIRAYFSPYFLPRYPRQEPPADAPLCIAAAGVVSFDRRDYRLLVEVAGRLASRGRGPAVVFDIVGEARDRDGPELRRIVAARGLDGFFRFHSRLTDDDFFQRLNAADFISPLVRPGEGPYADGKVTLAYGNSGALGRPLLIHRAVAHQIQLPDAVCATYENADELLAIIRTGRAAAECLVSPYRDYVRAEIAANHAHLAEVRGTLSMDQSSA